MTDLPSQENRPPSDPGRDRDYTVCRTVLVIAIPLEDARAIQRALADSESGGVARWAEILRLRIEKAERGER